ncbi:hypothetical protein ACQPZA_13855 [Pseudonocardia xinjiangensis]|uniref:hypothetical protein n=1 Tax=Pseudonocardia xinjiangensis TaxID=75289 RepID=UPI003D92CCE3
MIVTRFEAFLGSIGLGDLGHRLRGGNERGGHELARVGMLRVAEQGIGIAGLDNFPLLHHDHPVAQTVDDAEIVGDDGEDPIRPAAGPVQQLDASEIMAADLISCRH